LKFLIREHFKSNFIQGLKVIEQKIKFLKINIFLNNSRINDGLILDIYEMYISWEMNSNCISNGL
jgi:hypothetical protein